MAGEDRADGLPLGTVSRVAERAYHDLTIRQALPDYMEDSLSHPAPPGARTAAVGAYLAATLATAGLTTTAAADIIRSDPADLEEAIAGVAPLYIQDIEALADRLGVPAVSLLVC